MNETLARRVSENPKFRELVQKRSRLGWTLSAVMLGVYFAFILTIAFSPASLGVPLSSGVTTLGIPLGVAIILAAFVLTGVYVHKANTEFDRLTAAIAKEAR